MESSGQQNGGEEKENLVFTINAGRIEALDVADDSLINSRKIKKVNKQIILEETKSGGFYP